MDSVASVWMVGMLLATAVIIVLAWMCYDLKVRALGRDSDPGRDSDAVSFETWEITEKRPAPKPVELGDDDTHI